MISSPTTTCRRRKALRAALIALLALTGCQGSLRSWRRDEPALRDLIAAKHPVEAAKAHDRDTGRNAYAETPSTQRSRNGRANPYAAQVAAEEESRFESADQSGYEQLAEDGLDEEADYQLQDAKFRQYVSQADPAHRAMLEQAYQAMQTFGQTKSNSRISDDREPIEGEYDEEQAAEAIHRLTRSKQSSKSDVAKTKTKAKAGSDVASANYSTSDRRQTSEDEAYSEVRPASATRAPAGEDLGNRARTASHADEPVHIQFKDDSEDATSDEAASYEPEASASADRNSSSRNNTSKPATKAVTKLQEITPPSKSNSQKRVVKEPTADTGYEDEIQIVSVKRAARDNDSASSRRNTSTTRRATDVSGPAAPEEEPASGIDSHYTDSSQVVQASAASANAANPESNVEPATSSRRTANPAASTGASLEDSHALMRRTLRALEQEPAEDNPNAQLNHHVTKRILYVLLGELDQALEPIPGLQSREQEYFRHNLQALYNSIDPRGNPVLARRWPMVMENHRTAMSHLGAVSNLQVKNAAFCSNVEGFGSVTKFPTNQFKPNQELLLYCEVENFVSEEIKGGYETKLRGNYEIVDANQTRVADFLLPQETDMCSSPRRDYFFVYRIYTPQSIAPGRYQLRLTIEDMKGNKFGQTSLDMQISGQ